jgi:hypothetical protein
MRTLVPSRLMGEDDLPEQVELVWHGVNDRANLRQFLASPVRWCECDVRCDLHRRPALRHDPFDPSGPSGAPLLAEDLLVAARDAGRAVKLDVKERDVLDDLLTLVRRVGIAPEDLWVNGRLDVLGRGGVRRIREEHPAAVVQCPVDHLAPALLAERDRDRAPARARLAELASWGVTRFSLAWDADRSATLVDRFDRWGFEVNIYAVEGLDDFLRAVLLLPRSVTADFNFPEWHYFGRGAGHGGRHHRYHLDPAPPAVDVA